MIEARFHTWCNRNANVRVKFVLLHNSSMGRCVYVQSKWAPCIFVSIVLRASVRNNRLQVENVCVQIDLGACLTQFIALVRPLMRPLSVVPIKIIGLL